ncbi:MAG: hypothetical protein ACO3RB_03635 [Ilumatobacteraceae bacterium]
MPGVREVMPFSSLVRALARHAEKSVDDVRRQAPGAKMIGQFAVRSGVAALRRRLPKL